MEALGASDLAEKFVHIIRFLVLHPECASKLRGKASPDVGTPEYVMAAAKAFVNGRCLRKPTPPQTQPDAMVGVILEDYFGVPKELICDIQKWYSFSMGAENFIGDLLERYLAQELEPKGWIWISGSLVKGADLLKPPALVGDAWRVLQVKNRDNSENSSSSAIRKGTVIEKWFRTFSKRSGSNWEKFPESSGSNTLSEERFIEFVRVYLREVSQSGEKATF